MSCLFQYNNEWISEAELKEIFDNGTFSQLSEAPLPSRANDVTIGKVREFLKRIGIDIKQVDDIVVNGIKQDANGIARITQNLVEYVAGTENVSLTEEAMHFAVELIEKYNNTLYRQMFNKIGQYSMYNDVLSAYRNTYTINGKPDIIKIKKEAIAKVLTEQFINLNEGMSEKPELLAFNNSWWQKVVEWLKNKFGQAVYNPFEEAAKSINTLSGTIDGGGEFFQKTPGKNAVDFKTALQEKVKKYNIQKVVDDKALDEEDRNYYKGVVDGKEKRLDRTTDYAKRENKKNSGGRDFLADATKEQKAKYQLMADEGTKAHNDLENIVNSSLNADGILKADTDISFDKMPNSTSSVYNELKNFLLGNPSEGKEGFLRQFPIGSVFITEQVVFNEKTQRAGTMDLVVSLPDGSKKVYDWKFMGWKEGKIDQAPQKRSQHALQLSDYRRTLREGYGEKDVQLFTVPFGAIYEQPEKGNIFMKDVKTGNINAREEKNTFLLPVTPVDQSTGNKIVDDLIKSLLSLYKRIYSKVVGPEEKFSKNQQLNQLSLSVRNLQAALNFEPITIQAKSFHKNLKGSIEAYNAKDVTSLSKEELISMLSDLVHLDKAATTYANIDKVFASEYGTDDLSEEQQKIYDSLKLLSSTIENSREEVGEILGKSVTYIAEEHGITNILSPEKQVKGIINEFTEAANLPQRTIKLLTKLVVEARSRDIRAITEQVEEFGKLYINLIGEAKGSDPLSLIGNSKTLELKQKIKKEFWLDFKVAKESKDKKFILANIDVDKYNKLAEEKYEKRKKEIEDAVHAVDEVENNSIKDSKIVQLGKSLFIGKEDFNGWEGFDFNSIFKKAFKEDFHYSDEFKEMSNNLASIAMWNFITELNRKAYGLGYLGQNNSMRFLPLIQGTIIERLAQADSLLAESRALGKDTFTIQVNEQQAFGQIDPETNKLIKSIPKLFTHTNKDKIQLSKDLLKIIPLYIRALREYETSKELEYTALAIHRVEQAKGHFDVDGNNNVVFEGGEPKVFKGNENNARIVEVMMDDAIYGIKQEGNTLVDIAIDKFKKGSEEDKNKTKLSTKKVIQESNKLTQSLAVGLKILVAVPNYVGAHIQAIINSSTYYKAKEYEINHARVVGSVFQGKEGNVLKGLMDLIIPLNEDVVKEGQRGISRKQSPLKYLSTWSMQEVLMSTNRLPDVVHQLTNAYSWVENTAVVNGKLVNIRQYLKAQDRNKYNNSEAERRIIENSFEDRVKEMKENSIVKTARFNTEGYLEIPGVDENEISAYRARVVEYGRYITGQMSHDNKAQYRRNIIANSFMMFKNWIPKQVAIRTLDIQKNVFQGEWEYGRTRLFIKTLSHLGFKNILAIRDISRGTDKGLEIMREILESKREDYYKKTGQQLEITDEEFFDLMRKEIAKQYKELGILLGLLGMVIAAKAMVPDDEDKLTKNRYKFWAKAINKISDELWFYYSPTSAESITRGSVIPSLGLLTKLSSFLHSFEEESRGYIIGDDQLMDKQHPLKYFLNLVPGASQFQNELLPIIDPEAAKNMGIISSTQARAGR